jgi:hypothetical protein
MWWKLPIQVRFRAATGLGTVLEDHIEVPFDIVSGWLVGLPLRKTDHLTSSGVELLAVTELRAQSGTDEQSVTGVDAEVPGVEQRVHVRAQEHAIGQQVLAAGWQRSDVRRLEHGADVGVGDGTAPVVGSCIEITSPFE